MIESQQIEIADAVGALPVLPVDNAHDRYGARGLTAAWIAQLTSRHTRKAYFTDLARYLAWCQLDGLDPLLARPVDVDRYKATLTGAASSVNRRLSSLSSWYRYLHTNGAVDSNPLAAVRRPNVDRDASTTLGMTVSEVKQLLVVADQIAVAAAEWSSWRRLTAHRDRAVVRCLADMGMRVDEVVQLDREHMTHNRGYRTLRYTGKGAKLRERAMPAHLLEALDEYLELRPDIPGALFVTRSRGDAYGRIDAACVFRLVRRLAAIGQMPAADRYSPHVLRHAFATNARDAGIALEDVQDAMGHADPRTTRRYDRARNALHREPGLRLGELYADE